jgi:tetratricopeptide (TPR) repeat protein
MRISRKARFSAAALLGVLLFFGGCASPSKPRLSADAQAEALSRFSLGLLAEAGGDSTAAFEHLSAAVRLDPGEERLYTPAVAIALKLGQTNDAVRLARELLKRHPESPEPPLLLARVYALSGYPDLAEPLLQKTLAAFPGNPDAAVFLARFYLSQDRSKDAQEILRAAVQTQRENVGLLHLLGTLCIDSARDPGDSAEAKAAVQEGISLLQQALDLDPQDSLRWQQLGFAQLAIRQPDKALKSFQEARLYAPSDLTPARHLFELLIQTGDYDQAMEIYDQLAADTGTEPELWLQLLAEKMPEEQRTRLTEHLETQIRAQPQPPVFHYAQLGSLYIGAGENDKAEGVLIKALERYPDDNRLRIVLGYLNLQQERYAEAYTALEQVRTGSPEAGWSSNPFFIFNFLTAAQKSGHLQQAAETLARTYTSNPVVLNQYMSTLLTGESTVSTDGMIELLTLFRTLSPEAAEALYYLMVLQADQKEYRKAIETAKQFETLVQKSGDTNLLSGQFYYQYAALHERTGQLEPAERLFFKAIELGEKPLAAAAQNYIAYMWAERGEKLDTGLKLIRKALAVDPENGAFLDTLGWIYYMQGRYAEALTELRKASELDGDDPTVWEHLGDTCLKLGNLDEASKHWKKALELDPKSERLKERLKESGFPAPENIPADTPPRP